MSSESALELRVGRLENDSAALYDLLDRFHSEFDDFRAETRSEFAKVNGTLEQILRRLPAGSN